MLLTNDDILDIVQSKGEFGVSLRKSDAPLMARCLRLKAKGLLAGGRRRGRCVIFTRGEKADAPPQRQVRQLAGP